MNIELEREKKLIEDAKKNPQDFGVLYDLHFERIFRYVSRRISDRALVEDLVSQTFLDALNNIERYKFMGYPFSAWLYKIAHNNVLKSYQRNTQKSTIDLEEIAELRSSENLSDEAADNYEISQMLKNLELLDIADRELIRLKYFEELSNIDIAMVMGISANNVGVKLFRALKKLRNIIENE